MTSVHKDYLANSELQSLVAKLSNPTMSSASPRQDIVGQPTGGDGSNDPTCNTTGSTCQSGVDKGLTVIGITQALPSSTTFFADTSSPNFDVSAVSAVIGGQFFASGRYVLQKASSCAVAQVSDFVTSVESIAEGIVGGTLLPYITTANIATLSGSASGLLSGSVSAAGFWDVLIAVLGTVTLSNLLLSIGAGIVLSVGIRTAWCIISTGG